MFKRALQFGVVISIAAAGACAHERDEVAPTPLTTWRDDVAAVVEQRCASAGCHAAPAPAAGYDLTSYLGALGTGSDAEANAIAGDSGSLILSKLDGPAFDDLHIPSRDVVTLLRAWVVDSRMAYQRSRIHEPGLLNPADAQFHGAELERRGWDFATCANCHGKDFTGGPANASCTTCHAGGPTACATCHQDGPTTGAHRIHREIARLDCAECHSKPPSWDAVGHLFQDAGGKVVDPAPAEVTFGATAALTLVAADRKGPPKFDQGVCTNVYCHGDALHAGGGSTTAPRWDDPAPPGACNRCHGAPPPSHAQDQCATCHPASAPHVDGVVQVGRTTGCDGCHGTAASPAPPIDLVGNPYTTAIGVGAHQAHLNVPSRLRGPIACATCHRVPSSINEPGHLDTPLPAEVDATLGWNRITATCGTAWCHGPATPRWTLSGEVGCGTCHGIPPLNPSHTAGMPLTECVTCHARTVDAFGNILVTAGPGGLTSEHMDGAIDVF